MEVDEKNGLSADSIATVDVDNLGSNISLLRLKLRLGLRESWKDGFHYERVCCAARTFT